MVPGALSLSLFVFWSISEQCLCSAECSQTHHNPTPSHHVRCCPHLWHTGIPGQTPPPAPRLTNHTPWTETCYCRGDRQTDTEGHIAALVDTIILLVSLPHVTDTHHNGQVKAIWLIPAVCLPHLEPNGKMKRWKDETSPIWHDLSKPTLTHSKCNGCQPQICSALSS